MTFNSKKITLITFLALLLITIPITAQTKSKLPFALCQEKDSRIQVMLLGSYHMSNPEMDEFNLKADDVLAEKRQKELRQLANKLATFKPTKIAVESPFKNKSAKKKYSAYLDEKYKLGKSEREQIGFRLAKKLNHKTVYPIDFVMQLNNVALGKLIKSEPKYQKNLAELNKFGNAAIAQMAKWLSEGTISDMLYQMNRQEFLKQAHLPYVWILAPIVKDDNYAGADMVASWYKRNLRIFANLNRIAEKEDRILVVYGQGHIPILQDLVEDSPDFCRVSPLPYLKD